jgi:hypothetical protein
MFDIDELRDWIANPPMNRGAVPYILNFGLADFARAKKGLDFLKSFGNRIEELAKRRGHLICRVNLSNFIVAISDQEMSVSGFASDAKLLLLRLMGQEMPDYFGTVDVNRVVQLIDLRRYRDRAIALIERLVTEAKDSEKLANSMDLLAMEHIGRIEEAHRQLGDARFADLFLRSQEIALNEGGKPFAPVMSEFYVSMSSIRQRLLTGIDMRHNKNVFNQLTVTLDRILFTAIDSLRRPDQRASVNLNIESVFSREFEAFERRTLNTLRRFNFEFRIGDIMQNHAEFLVARDLIQSHGGTVAIDGLTPALVSLVDMTQLNPNMVKVFWQPGIGPELMKRRAQLDRLRAAGIVLALARVDDDEGVGVGRELKFGMFQGFRIDQMLHEPPPVPLSQIRSNPTPH